MAQPIIIACGGVCAGLGVLVLKGERRALEGSFPVPLEVVEHIETVDREGAMSIRLRYRITGGPFEGTVGLDPASSVPAAHPVGARVFGLLERRTGHIRSDRTALGNRIFGWGIIALGTGLVGWGMVA